MTYNFSLFSHWRVNLTTTTFVLSFILALSLTLISIVSYNSDYYPIISSVYARPQVSPDGPILNDPNLIVETVYQGLKSPTSMAFLGPNDILVLEKGQGTVQRIVNGKILPEPLIQLDVTSKDERGLLGIAIASNDEKGGKESQNKNDGTTITTTTTTTTTETNNENRSYPPSKFVFLFFTEAGESKGDTSGSNRVYKYQLVENNTKLANPTLLLDLPAMPDDSHVGGALQVGPDNNLYLTIGDQRPTAFDRTDDPDSQTKAQNYVDGREPDGRSGILRITQAGGVVGEGIFGNEHPLNKYYAIGVKNSFGLDFDPITGTLWDTENGPTFGDEINLVEPGFNSGWASIQGFWTLNDKHKKVEEITATSINAEKNVDYGLLDFDGKGKYRSPEFVWDVAPTALTFLNSDKFGQQYENDIFVGDAKYGNLYHFKLNEQRTGLLLDGPLEDKVGSVEELQQQGAIFGQGFGVITDIEVGPDGYLYILSFGKEGNMYRIVPATVKSEEIAKGE
jgi:glucose/arabinose dehydrogenase